MKKMFLLLAAGLFLMVSQASAAVDGSAHDFINGSGNFTGYVGGLCEPCHVPHKPKQNVPLWAQDLSAVTDYEMYNQNTAYTGSGTYTGGGTSVDFTGTGSAACLSCHDGTVAAAGSYTIASADAVWILYDWETNGATGVVTGANTNLGLKGSHPVAVDYPGAVPGNYNDISAHPTLKLEAGQIQCNTCHGAHNDVAGEPMLVTTNVNSAMCVACHIK